MQKQNTTTWSHKLLAGILVLMLVWTFSYAMASADEATTQSGITAVTGFSDVPRSHPQYAPISYLNQIGVINGYPDGTFKPANPINRAEVLKIILSGSAVEIPEVVNDNPFPDVDKEAWFARFVKAAKALEIVKGNDVDGTFTPGRQVNKAEFIKMLLVANRITDTALESVSGLDFADVPEEAWFTPYVKYAASVGIINQSAEGKLNPSLPMTRGDVAESMYILNIIQRGKDTQFLLDRAEAEMAQIEVYVAANRIDLAKRASELAVDLTQQAYKNLPDNKVVLGAAKLARSYDWLVDSFVLGIKKDFTGAAEWANKAIDKATEAWEANNATQPIAKHIKERAREILSQVGGSEE